MMYLKSVRSRFLMFICFLIAAAFILDCIFRPLKLNENHLENLSDYYKCYHTE